ncbi:MAG: pyridoxal-phosphate dependent enzyme [Paracoccaceae bacterium]|nr:pyridoxal-phosphate dependent enzyme [Paracoccaceae bacterium]
MTSSASHSLEISTSEMAARAVIAHKRIQTQIYKTPLLPSKTIGSMMGCDLFFKADNFQLTGSFKIRGASNKMSAMTGPEKLITASSGNHGIACAKAAQTFKRDLTVVLPETVAKAKLAKIKSYGVKVILEGAESGLAEMHAQKLAADTEGLIYVSPYNDADVVAGQGSVALELLEQHSGIDNIFVSMGGGGLISGIGAVIKSFSPNTRIIGVAAKNSAALAASMVAGSVVETEHHATLADGVAGGMDQDSVTLALAIKTVDQVIICNEAEITASLRRLAHEEHQLVEGSAALALAGFEQAANSFKGATNVVLLCGSNYDKATLEPLLAG